MDWTAPINAYCERLGPGYWAEPVNALSNAAFILAGLAALRIWHRRGGDDLPVLILTVIIFLVGIGSFLFHTHANYWSLLADVLPITLFIYVYFFFAMRRMIGMGAARAILALVGFILFSLGFRQLFPPGLLHGSAGYLPALLALLAVAAVLRLRGQALAQSLLAAAGLFAVSLTFRTIDPVVCHELPVGTHFLWHVLNAILLLVLVRLISDARDVVPAFAPRTRIVSN